MTTEGWIFFALGWGVVGTLALWCFWRLIGSNNKPPPADDD